MVAPLVGMALSFGASLLPTIVNTLLGSKTAEEAKRAIYPQFNALVQQKLSGGMGRVEAHREADVELADAVLAERAKGPIPPWLEATLGIAGGLGVAGATGLAGKALAKGRGLFGKGKLEAPKPKSALDNGIDKVDDTIESALERRTPRADPELGPGTARPAPMDPVRMSRDRQVRQPPPDSGPDLSEMAEGDPGTTLADVAAKYQRGPFPTLSKKGTAPTPASRRPAPQDNPNPSTPNAQIQGVDIEQEIAEAIEAPSRGAVQSANRQLSNQKMAELIASKKQAGQGLPRTDMDGVDIELPEDRGAFPMTDPYTLAGLLGRFQR